MMILKSKYSLTKQYDEKVFWKIGPWSRISRESQLSRGIFKFLESE